MTELVNAIKETVKFQAPTQATSNGNPSWEVHRNVLLHQMLLSGILTTTNLLLSLHSRPLEDGVNLTLSNTIEKLPLAV